MMRGDSILAQFFSLDRSLELLDKYDLEELFTYFYEIYADLRDEGQDIYLTNDHFILLLNLLTDCNIQYASALNNFFNTHFNEMIELFIRHFKHDITSITVYDLLNKYCDDFLFGFSSISELEDHLITQAPKLNIELSRNKAGSLIINIPEDRLS